MDQIKLISDGVMMARYFHQMSAQAKWVAAGSFNLNTRLLNLAVLPQDSQLIVGIPREEPAKANCLRSLSFAAMTKRIMLFAHEDFHAKYALFRMARSKWVMLGSANLTHSPAAEVVVLGRDDHLFDLLAKKHERWLLRSTRVIPYNSPKMAKADLKALSSAVVGG